MFEKRVVHHAVYVFIGAGIMNATLGMFLQEINTKKKMMIFERMDEMVAESSSGWNNADTIHTAQYKPNYPPEDEDASRRLSEQLYQNET
ncbi:MAG: malate:quinone oxidoreductase [Phycisphaerales bacterium]|nr:malate:quinone oxidoreductase [Phycisphaerales bacterium]